MFAFLSFLFNFLIWINENSQLYKYSLYEEMLL